MTARCTCIRGGSRKGAHLVTVDPWCLVHGDSVPVLRKARR